MKTLSPSAHGVTWREAWLVWLRVAALSFGGPAGQIATMHRIVVDEKRWIGERRFLHALSFCTLLPGPEAQQLAIYIGWLMHGRRGGLLAGGLFVLPGAIALMALSVVYVRWGQTGIVTGLFFGVKAAVVAVVAQAVLRLARRALRDRLLGAIAVASFIAVFAFGVSFPLVLLAAALLGWWGERGQRRAQSAIAGLADEDSRLGAGIASAGLDWRMAAAWLTLWLLPVAALLIVAGKASAFTLIALFFSKMAVVTFGGAYSVMAYVAQQAVGHYHWVSPAEMLDGLGMAETTPGPLIMVNQFVGFLAGYRHAGGMAPMLAGVLAGLLTSWVTFAPCFLWVFVGAPYAEALRGSRALAGALSGVSAAVVGVIANLAVWFALHGWFGAWMPVQGFGLALELPVLASVSWFAMGLSAVAGAAIFVARTGLIPTLLACALLGLALNQ